MILCFCLMKWWRNLSAGLLVTSPDEKNEQTFDPEPIWMPWGTILNVPRGVLATLFEYFWRLRSFSPSFSMRSGLSFGGITHPTHVPPLSAINVNRPSLNKIYGYWQIPRSVFSLTFHKLQPCTLHLEEPSVVAQERSYHWISLYFHPMYSDLNSRKSLYMLGLSASVVTERTCDFL